MVPPRLLLNVCWAFYVQRPGRDANHSPPSSDKFQNDGKYTFISPIYFRGVYRDNLPFTHVYYFALTLWPLSWTFQFQHTIYVKCEYSVNQKGNIVKYTTFGG
jgi:hypothetical protein